MSEYPTTPFTVRIPGIQPRPPRTDSGPQNITAVLRPAVPAPAAELVPVADRDRMLERLSTGPVQARRLEAVPDPAPAPPRPRTEVSETFIRDHRRGGPPIFMATLRTAGWCGMHMTRPPGLTAPLKVADYRALDAFEKHVFGRLDTADTERAARAARYDTDERDRRAAEDQKAHRTPGWETRLPAPGPGRHGRPGTPDNATHQQRPAPTAAHQRPAAAADRAGYEHGEDH